MKGITVRSILIGLAIVVFVNVASPYTESRAFSNFSWSYLPEGGMIPFLFVLFLNLLLRRFLPRSALTSGELLRFLWWPIYPLPYVMASTWSLSKIWFSVFIGWLLRVLIERSGGFKVYARLRPLFIGAIVGEALIIVLWLIIDALTGTVGHNLFPGAD